MPSFHRLAGRPGARAAALAVAVGGLLIVAAGGLAISSHAREEATLSSALQQEVTAHAALLEQSLTRARGTTLLLASHPVFHSTHVGAAERAEANAAFSYLEALYPNAIGEACFISRKGAELARVVKGKSAPPSELSPDESGSPFFNGAFAQQLGSVYQSQPYVSPDTHEWVIANVTPVSADGATKSAIVHYEVTLESIRRDLAAGSSYQLMLVDARNGYVVADTHRAMPTRSARVLSLGKLPGFAQVTDSEGVSEVAGRPAAYRRVDVPAGDANQWMLVAAAPGAVAWSFSTVGAMSLVTLLAALAAFAAAPLILRSAGRRARAEAERRAELAARQAEEERREQEEADRREQRTEALASLAGDIQENAHGLAFSAQSLDGHAARGRSAVEAIVKAMDDLASGVERQRQTLGSVQETAGATEGLAENGTQSADRAEHAMRRVREEATGLLSSVAELEGRTEQISEIMSAIESIAESTNLLALNAAIEAARAGEHGRGFAVVADEVRSLAEQSREATRRVEAIVQQVREASRESVLACRRNDELIDESVHVVEQVRSAFAEIAGATTEVRRALSALAEVADETARTTADVVDTAEQSRAASGETLEAAREFASAAERLDALTRRFALD